MEHTLNMRDKEQKSLTDIINQYLSMKNVKLPVFDKTILQIHQELTKQDHNIKVIEKLICTDPVLTGHLLRTANSSFFRGINEVTKIRDAIIRIGIKEMTNLFVLVAQRDNFRSKDPFILKIMKKLWEHSVTTAFVAQHLAKTCGHSDISHEAFLAGLLHDVGKLVLLTVFESAKLYELPNFQSSTDNLNEVLKALHTEYGCILMEKWNLPLKYKGIVRDHHLETFDETDFLLMFVRLADKISNKLGYGLSGLKADQNLELTIEAKILNLSESQFEKLEVIIEDLKGLAL